MKFCKKCGSLMKPKKEGAKKLFVCSCGHEEKAEAQPVTKETIDHGKGIEVVEDNEKVYPLTDASCPKCNHDKAYYWLVQTRTGDEPETKFLKCEKCKHTWRDYS